MPSQHDSLSCRRATLNPQDRIAATEAGLASWAPSKMLFSLTHAYSVPDVLAPRSTTVFPSWLTKWFPLTAIENPG